jgi:hypothetical protein
MISMHCAAQAGLAFVAAVSPCEAAAQAMSRSADTITVASMKPTAVRVRLEKVTYRGRPAVHLIETRPVGDTVNQNLPSFAVLDYAFSTGAIKLQVASRVRAGADTAAARGFVGLAFHLADTGEVYRAFYIRPLNSRAREQLRRNRSAQYVSIPDYPWPRLRREEPGVYETYVDLEPAAWTTLRIEVVAGAARLYVGDASQPTLVVTDLKPGPNQGRLALWIDAGTEAWFSDIVVVK